jgi:hypothetical protein
MRTIFGREKVTTAYIRLLRYNFHNLYMMQLTTSGHKLEDTTIIDDK